MRIPVNGRKIYVTLFSYVRGEWHWYDYEYEAPSPVTQDRSVLINITNKLVYGVNFLVNGRVVGSVPAGETRSTTVTVSELRMSYEVNQPALSGRTLGDTMSGSWSSIASPATRYDMTIDNVAGDTTFFAPRVTNRTGTSIALEVNGGLASQNRCNCTAPAYANDVAFGYYKYFRNSNVRAYRDGSGYSGRYIYWGVDSDGDGTQLRIDDGSGLTRLNANSAPVTRQAGGPQHRGPPAATAHPLHSGFVGFGVMNRMRVGLAGGVTLICLHTS